MQRVWSNLLLMLFLLILIGGFSTSTDQVIAAGSYNRVWKDRFDSAALNPAWHISNPNPANWSLILTGNTYLRITTEENYLETGQEHEPYNQFMVNVPDGDFRAKTYVKFNPVDNGQFAGMRIWMSSLDYIEIILTYGSVKNEVHWNINQGGKLTEKNPPGDYDKAFQGIYLSITRTGSTYKGEIQSEGTPGYYPIGSYTADYPKASIDLVAGNSLPDLTSIPADFDYLSIEFYAPYLLFMPTMRR